jgi:predicted aldo/keto reductase-like oxidoreductase
VLYRRFGRTALDLSVFSCGGMRAQQSWSRAATVTQASQRNLEATVARALAVGINHFETARGYGTTEAQLGRALAPHPRDAFVLQTKIRPHADPAAFEAQLEESFALLRVQTLDLFSFHGLNTPSCLELTLRARGCWEVAERFRRAGRIRHIGFSTHAPLPLLLDAIRSDRFDYVNLHYYYIFQDNLPAIRAARERDMGVFIISPTDKGGRLHRPSAKLRALCAPLSPLAFNDLWCLAHPQIHTLSLGAASPADFDAHVEALPLLDGAAAALPPIVARLERAYRDALGEAFAEGWRAGLREWNELPGRINVRRILWLHNLVRAFDLVEYAQERYAAMGPENHWVPGARAADSTTPRSPPPSPTPPSAPRSPPSCARPTPSCITRTRVPSPDPTFRTALPLRPTAGSAGGAARRRARCGRRAGASPGARPRSSARGPRASARASARRPPGRSRAPARRAGGWRPGARRRRAWRAPSPA